MCQFKSDEAVRINETDIQVYMFADTDSHTEIRNRARIDEATGGMKDRLHTPLEYIPSEELNLPSFEGWKLVFDDDRPAWWTESMTEQAIKQSQKFILENHFINGGFVHGGSANFGSLTAWPAGTPFKCGGYAYFRILQSWPANTPFECGGSADFNSLQNWPAGTPFKCGGSAYFKNLQSWPANTPFECGGYAYFGSLTAWPAGTPFKCGGYANFNDGNGGRKFNATK